MRPPSFLSSSSSSFSSLAAYVASIPDASSSSTTSNEADQEQNQPLALSLETTYAVDELAPFLSEFKANLDRHRRVSDSGAGLKRKRDAEAREQDDADVACVPKSLLRYAKFFAYKWRPLRDALLRPKSASGSAGTTEVGFEYRLRLARALVRLEVLDSSQVESMTAPEPDRSGTEGMSEEMSEFARACDQAFSRLDERSLEEVCDDCPGGDDERAGVEHLLLRCYGVGLLEGKSVSQFPDVLIRSRVGPLVSSLLVSLLSTPLALKLTSHHVLTLSHFLADLSSGPFKARGLPILLDVASAVSEMAADKHEVSGVDVAGPACKVMAVCEAAGHDVDADFADDKRKAV
eukprot:CAMPEP_0197558094 /NCGR_PEP_ID=MMETSP1320-20131121/18407_1 /TAXON_ID=91990 /ORGANISM="Bolidomonas sp., Strain RCC2347" /LENGTH=347 /DNA_ID=CAMNT_0043119373 /DNA_START=92 /DNA_END=1132 /DNA_ORIENTATION=+